MKRNQVLSEEKWMALDPPRSYPKVYQILLLELLCRNKENLKESKFHQKVLKANNDCLNKPNATFEKSFFEN